MNTSKGQGKFNQGMSQRLGEEDQNGNKPLASTLLQEFQNLKDKFKTEDEGYEKGKIDIRFPSSH